jgi:hypothetical protein
MEGCGIGRTGYSPDFRQRPEGRQIKQFRGDNLVLHKPSKIRHSKRMEDVVSPTAGLHYD